MTTRLAFRFLAAFFTLYSTSATSTYAQDTLRMKVGVQLQDGDIKAAKGKQKVKTTDSLQVHVAAKQNGYLYIIHFDDKTATLLNAGRTKADAETLMMMPAAGQYYKFDGTSKKEGFSIICSRTERADLTRSFAKPELPRSEWNELEKKLEAASNLALGQASETGFAMAGNVRAPGKRKPISLTVFSGKTLVMRRYEFEVEK